MKARSQLAEDVDCYNVAMVTLEEDAIVSQYGYLCTASHDVHNADFTLITAPIKLGSKSWVCAKAMVCFGVTLGEGSVAALGSVVIKPVKPWSIVGGNPAREIGIRQNCGLVV